MNGVSYQALRLAAENATPGEWCTDDYGVIANAGLNANYYIASCSGPDNRANKRFIAAANPATVLALLDERERNQQYIKRRDQENEEIALTVGKLRVELEEVKQHAEELSETKAVRNQWRPDICPITGRTFFMWIEHPTLGNVPTYGGPLDSYTIPTKDGDGEFSCERYDHDFGGWVESECLGLYLIDDREQCRVYELEERVKELETREVHLPTRYGLRYGHPINDDERHVMIPKENGCWLYLADLEHALRVAGIRIKGG
ncbi:ead/Ea22-like family protein [Escherichia coli]|uniref:ead/Ea22-like family protein n=1 Tax=Escherichia coli TaxID=562 RepID=UPI0005B50337|nr:ead/Ea22-like family protein [Escherichia coli]HDQ6721129.1 ead/Ea22-like family protein [Escherichia coli O146:H21]EEZ1445700.1 ead/Ea22-like family protein [Escherichia coli]EKJ2305202.1 ead/Ea22-like family protein [Escherichia coli]EKK0629071.1 ead/Ea22-like family protein [Escherichia coli]